MVRELKTIKDIEEYVESECMLIVNEPDSCYICGNSLVDNEGYKQYYLCDEYAPDEIFCSEECIKAYLINYLL